MNAMVTTNEEAEESWLSAEAVIQSFLDAVATRSTELPSGVEVGEACLWLLVLLAADPNGDGQRLSGELLECPAAVSLLALEFRVKSFLQAALAELERQARPADPTQSDFDLF